MIRSVLKVACAIIRIGRDERRACTGCRYLIMLAARPFHLELGAGRLMPPGLLTVHCQEIKWLGLRNLKNSENATSLTAMIGSGD